MSELEADRWSRPPELFIVGVVNVLKKTRRWSRDGRSLRQLNKYWCLQLGQHVDAVRPHESRDTSNGVAALLKFPNLTALELTKFLSDSRKGKIERLVKVIKRLPKISRLEISMEAISKLRDGEVSRLAATLSGIPWSVSPSLCCDLDDLPKLKKLSVTSLAFSYEHNPEVLVKIVESLPSLKTLEATVEVKNTDGFVRAMQRLEALKLIVRPTRIHASLPNVSQLSCLVSLDVGRYNSEYTLDLHALAQLPLLRSLEMPVLQDQLESPAFSEVLQKLVHLAVQPYRNGEIQFRGFLQKPINLQTLKLEFCRFTEGTTMENLSHLTSLELDTCSYYQGWRVQYLTSLRSLTKLSLLLFDRAFGWEPKQVPLNHETLPELTHLKIDIEEHQTAWMQLISGLFKLEILEVDNSRAACSLKEGLSHLEKLSELRVLNICGLGEDAPIHFSENLVLWQKLDYLYLSEDERDRRIHLNNMAIKLRELIPHLKIDVTRYMVSVGETRYPTDVSLV